MSRAQVQFSFTFIFAAAGILSGCNNSSDSAGAAETVAPVAKAPAPLTPVLTTSTDGSKIYAASCAGCHGATGSGGRAPVLASAKLGEPEVTRVVENGKGRSMPSFKGKLTDSQVQAVAKYVSTL
jgi:mono/diheme cytochrome c family protein